MWNTLSNADPVSYGGSEDSPCDSCNCLVVCDYMNSPYCTEIHLGHADLNSELKQYAGLFMSCVEDYKINRYNVFYNSRRQSKENEEAIERIEKLFFYLRSRSKRSK